METIKVTKQATRDYVKKQLATNNLWATTALLKIFNFQTLEEQKYEVTKQNNGIGFTGVDAEILSSFAKQFSTKKYLSEKQMRILFKRMPKYWMQIIKISDEEKLKQQVAKYLVS